MTKQFRSALEANLQNAIEQREGARTEFANATVGKTRRLAEETMNFWQGKVANLEALLKQN